MTKEDLNQPRNRFDEEKIDVEFVKKFIQEMLDDKENFTSQNPKIAKILKSMPAKLQAYLQELQALEKEKKLDDELNKTQQKPSEKRQKIQDRIEKIANEIFIISCASNNSLEKSLKFHEKCGLDKEFSKFGECGLSPLMAAMLSGKSTEDLQTLLNLGARINEKNAYGFTMLDFAEMVGVGSEVTGFLKENGARSLNSDQQKQEGLQREREREKKLEIDLEKKDLEREVIAKNQEDHYKRFEQEQIMIAQSMRALQLYEELIEAKKQAAAQQENQQEFTAKESQENISRDQKLQQSESESKIPEFENAKAEHNYENKTATELEIERMFDVDIDKVSINELLFNSVKDGQSMLAVLLVHCGADVNYRQGNKSVLDIAIEKGNGSLISILSTLSAPETVSNAFLKAVNNGNYSAQTLGALVGEKMEFKKENFSKNEFSEIRSERFPKKIKISLDDIKVGLKPSSNSPVTKAIDDIKIKPPSQISMTNFVNISEKINTSRRQ